MALGRSQAASPCHVGEVGRVDPSSRISVQHQTHYILLCESNNIVAGFHPKFCVVSVRLRTKNTLWSGYTKERWMLVMELQNRLLVAQPTTIHSLSRSSSFQSTGENWGRNIWMLDVFQRCNEWGFLKTWEHSIAGTETEGAVYSRGAWRILWTLFMMWFLKSINCHLHKGNLSFMEYLTMANGQYSTRPLIGSSFQPQ